MNLPSFNGRVDQAVDASSPAATLANLAWSTGSQIGSCNLGPCMLTT